MARLERFLVKACADLIRRRYQLHRQQRDRTQLPKHDPASRIALQAAAW